MELSVSYFTVNYFSPAPDFVNIDLLTRSPLPKFMTANFQAEVFQNAYLPAGSTEVHALMTVTTLGAAIGKTSTARGDRLFGIICDTSGSMDGAKIQDAGTVRLKHSVEKLDEMVLEAQPTLTTRIPKL
jgi:hypothetical protein